MWVKVNCLSCYSSNTAIILGLKILICGSCPVHSGMFGSIPAWSLLTSWPEHLQAVCAKQLLQEDRDCYPEKSLPCKAGPWVESSHPSLSSLDFCCLYLWLCAWSITNDFLPSMPLNLTCTHPHTLLASLPFYLTTNRPSELNLGSLPLMKPSDASPRCSRYTVHHPTKYLLHYVYSPAAFSLICNLTQNMSSEPPLFLTVFKTHHGITNAVILDKCLLNV